MLISSSSMYDIEFITPIELLEFVEKAALMEHLDIEISRSSKLHLFAYLKHMIKLSHSKNLQSLILTGFQR